MRRKARLNGRALILSEVSDGISCGPLRFDTPRTWAEIWAPGRRNGAICVHIRVAHTIVRHTSLYSWCGRLNVQHELAEPLGWGRDRYIPVPARALNPHE